MNDSPYIPFYTSDFLTGTGGLTAATKGVYITLLCLMYESEEPLPQRWDTLARRCGCTLPAFKKAIADLQDDAKIEVTEAGLWSDKCDKHLALRRDRRRGASASAKARWEKTEQKQGKPDANAMRTQCYSESESDIREEGKPSSLAKKRGSRLPSDWVLPREWGQWALSQQWSEHVIREQAERFRDYWTSIPGQRGVKLDWQATWRNWMRNSNSPKVHQGGPNVRQSSAKGTVKLDAALAAVQGRAGRA